MLKKIACGGTAATIFCLAGNAVEAASISWTTGSNFGGPNGYQAIDTTGTLVDAVNFGNTGPQTVDPNGLNTTFRTVGAANSPLNQYIFNSGSPNSTDTAWNTINNQTDWGWGNRVFNNFFTGLELGKQYQVQLFASDNRGSIGNRTQYFYDGLGNQSATFTQNTFTSIIGTFTADATTQALGIWTSSNAPILNAYVLRDLSPTNTEPVPEPLTILGTAAALGMGAVMKKRLSAS